VPFIVGSYQGCCIESKSFSNVCGYFYERCDKRAN